MLSLRVDHWQGKPSVLEGVLTCYSPYYILLDPYYIIYYIIYLHRQGNPSMQASHRIYMLVIIYFYVPPFFFNLFLCA